MAEDFGKLQNGIQVNPFEYPNEKCECGNETFVPGYIVKKIPGMLVGASDEKEVGVPVKVFLCAKCGKLSPADQKMFDEETKSAKAHKINNGSLII